MMRKPRLPDDVRGSVTRRHNGNPVLMLVAITLLPIAATLVQLSISRTREYEADRTGGDHARILMPSRRPRQARAGRGAAAMQVNPATRTVYIVNPLAR